jgi:hypothetical protein
MNLETCSRVVTSYQLLLTISLYCQVIINFFFNRWHPAVFCHSTYHKNNSVITTVSLYKDVICFYNSLCFNLGDRHQMKKYTMFYVFFSVIPRRLNFICQRFETLCLFRLHRQVGVECVECSETSAYKIQRPGNYPEENIQTTAKVWNQENIQYLHENQCLFTCLLYIVQFFTWWLPLRLKHVVTCDNICHF